MGNPTDQRKGNTTIEISKPVRDEFKGMLKKSQSYNDGLTLLMRFYRNSTGKSIIEEEPVSGAGAG